MRETLTGSGLIIPAANAAFAMATEWEAITELVKACMDLMEGYLAIQRYEVDTAWGP